MSSSTHTSAFADLFAGECPYETPSLALAWLEERAFHDDPLRADTGWLWHERDPVLVQAEGTLELSRLRDDDRNASRLAEAHYLTVLEGVYRDDRAYLLETLLDIHSLARVDRYAAARKVRELARVYGLAQTMLGDHVGRCLVSLFDVLRALERTAAVVIREALDDATVISEEHFRFTDAFTAEFSSSKDDGAPRWSTGIAPWQDCPPIDFYGLSILYGHTGLGKALAVDTPIATPNGWSTMGDLEVGDEVFGGDGHPCRIVAISPVMHDRECYELTFSDRAKITADAQHQWFTETRRDRVSQLTRTPEWRAHRRAKRAAMGANTIGPRSRASDPTHGSVKTTAEIAASVTVGEHRNHSIPLGGAIVLPDAELALHPYVLGVWLGDGRARDPGITTIDREIIDEIEACGFRTRDYGYASLFWVYELGKILRTLGLIENKHVPAEYLRASRSQRIALLQGLMDTDGSVGEGGTCEFTNTNEGIARAVWELVLSLGHKATIREGVATLDGRVIGPKWRVVFLPDEPVFRLSRKLKRQKLDDFRGTHRRRYVVACERVASVPVRCIEVDRADGLFLAGREMIPTHNSKLSTASALLCAENECAQVVYVNAELSAQVFALYAHQWSGMSASDMREKFANVTLCECVPGASTSTMLSELVAKLKTRVHENTEHLLVVFDTINSILAMQTNAEKRADYFGVMQHLGLWMMQARKLSNGRVSFLVVSEENREGNVLGEKLARWADMVLQIREGGADNVVEFEVKKGRFTGRVDLGSFKLEYDRCRFRKS